MSLFHQRECRGCGQPFTDDFSRFRWAFFLGTKDETFYILKDFIALIENQLNKKVKAIRCDNGIEFQNAKLIDLYGKKGIKRDYSNARTPQQNEVAERKNRTLIAAVRSMLADFKLPTMFWTKAVNTACYVLNRVSITNPHNKTPYELLSRKVPNIIYLKPFRCQVTILNTSDHLGKFEGKANEGFLIGYVANSKAYRVYNLSTKKIEETLNLRYLEDKPNVQGLGQEWYFDLDYLTDSLVPTSSIPTSSVPASSVPTSSVPAGSIPTSSVPASSVPAGSIPTSSVPASSVPAGGVLAGSVNSAGFGDPAASESVPDVFNPDHADHSTLPPGHSLGSSEHSTRFPSPSNLGNHQPKAGIFSSSSYDDDFCVAKALEDPDWVAAMQEEMHNSSISKQEEGIDYDEVFALVARIEAIRLFLAFASYMGFMVYQMDVKSAFLYGEIKEEVYVTQPKRFEDPHNPKHVYRVFKALYGLHQAPRAWYARLSTFLLKHHYKRGTIDKTLFLKKDSRHIILVQVYVDDIIFGSMNKAWCDEFEVLMKGEFEMSAMGELTFFLGLQVKQLSDGIFISQDKYVKDMLKKFDMESVRTATTPYEVSKLKSKDEPDDAVNVHLYRSMIGSLMYLTASRPDIMFAVSACSRHQLEAYNDSDYAGSHGNKKSTTGGCQFLDRRLISWQCKKQTIVATSSTEAKYVVVANCCGQSTICIVKNPVFHQRTKHIEIRHHFIRDANEKNLIQVLKIHTDENVADFLTKAFDGLRFHYLVFLLVVLVHADGLIPAGPSEIIATIDGNEVVVTESLIRTQLQLNDETGLYEFTLRDVLDGMWEIGTYNFFRFILDGMIGNIGSKRHKFLMYPRFLQMILDGPRMPLLALMLVVPGARDGADAVTAGAAAANEVLPPPLPHVTPPPDVPPTHTSSSTPRPSTAAQDTPEPTPEPPSPPPFLKDISEGGGGYVSLPKSNEAPPTIASIAVGGVEDSVVLTYLSLKLDRCINRVTTLENELGVTKKVLGGAVLKLVSWVKMLEGILQQRKRKMVLSDSKGEEAAKKEQEINLDALHDLASTSLGGDTTVEATSTIYKASQDAHASLDVGPDKDETIPVGNTPIPTTRGVSAGSFMDLAGQAATAAPSSSTIPATDKGKAPMVDDFILVDLLTEQERTLKNLHDYQLGEDLANKLQAEQEAEFARQQEELAQKAQAESDDVNKDNMNERLGMLLMRKRRELAEQSRVLASVPAAPSIAADVSVSTVSTITADVSPAPTLPAKSVAEVHANESSPDENQTTSEQIFVEHTSTTVAFTSGVSHATPSSSRKHRKQIAKKRVTPIVDVADDALIKFDSASESDGDPSPYAPYDGWEILPTPFGSIHAYYDMEEHTKHFTSLRELLHMSLADEDAHAFWRNQESWRIRSWRLYPRPYVHGDVMIPPKDELAQDVLAGCSCWFFHSCRFLVAAVGLFAVVLFRSCCWSNDAILELISEDLSRILKLTLSNSRLREDCWELQN
nr:putative ribonuclease H-like domain-containing protein [Tanacetum cinerariifolium]